MMTTQIWPLHQTPELRNHLSKRNRLMRSQFTSLKTEPKGPVNNMGVPHNNQIITNNNNLTRYTTHPLTPGKVEQEGVLGEVQGEDKMEVDEEVSTFNYKFLGYVQLQEVASKACNCFVVVVVILRI